MFFDENSSIVRSFVFLIRQGRRKLSDVPPLYNLYDVVKSIVEPEPEPEPAEEPVEDPEEPIEEPEGDAGV